MITTVAYGGGTNSTALCIGLVKTGQKPDFILFADTGGERPDIYEYVAMFSEWLQLQGFPPVTLVKNTNRKGESKTLEQDCLDRKALPSLAYGFKSCSDKYKQRPQHKYLRNHSISRKAWDSGEKLLKLIGLSSEETKRSTISEDRFYSIRYPLREWKWDRANCIKIIQSVGLALPGKSSCFFCPAMKKREILLLAKTQPQLLERALAIEENALENLKTTQGLGRNFSWKALIEKGESFPDQYETYSEFSPYCGCYDG